MSVENHTIIRTHTIAAENVFVHLKMWPCLYTMHGPFKKTCELTWLYFYFFVKDVRKEQKETYHMSTNRANRWHFKSAMMSLNRPQKTNDSVPSKCGNLATEVWNYPTDLKRVYLTCKLWLYVYVTGYAPYLFDVSWDHWCACLCPFASFHAL